MTVTKEVDVSDEEVNRVIVEELFRKERNDFYSNQSNDHYDFYTYDNWRRLEYEKAMKRRS